MTNQEQIAILKRIAMDNYERGGDCFIECYDQSDWEEFIANNDDPEGMLRTVMSVHHDRQMDAINSAF